MQFQSRLNVAILMSEAGATGAPIVPKDIYSFYYLTLLYQTGKLGHYGQEMAKQFLAQLKAKYLSNLIPLVKEQLYKYLERRRTDPNAYLKGHVGTNSAAELDRLMRTTYRSDMRRRNTVWESFTKNLAELEAATGADSIIYSIDRLNNDIHNTHELTLTKLDNGYDLYDALVACNEAVDEQQLRPYVYPDLRDVDRG